MALWLVSSHGVRSHGTKILMMTNQRKMGGAWKNPFRSVHGREHWKLFFFRIHFHYLTYAKVSILL